MSAWLGVYAAGGALWLAASLLGAVAGMTPSERRVGARGVLLTPLWPLMLLWLIGIGIVRLWALAEFGRADR